MASNTTISTMAVKLVGDVRDYETKMQRASRVTRESATNINDSLGVATRGTRSLNNAQVMVGRSTGQMGFRMQQAGYQVQDFFVQVGSGTSALRAFTQQAPQFLGVFGPTGAIAGAALAIGAVVTQIVLAGRETSKSAEKLKTYTEYVRELHTEMEKVRFENLNPNAQKDELQAQIEKRKSAIRELFELNSKLMAAPKALRYNESLPNGITQEELDLRLFRQGSTDNVLAKIGQEQVELQKLYAKVDELTKTETETATSAVKKQLDEIRSAAEAVIQRNLTPLEKFDESIKKLDEVFAKSGLLSVEQYNREVARLQTDLGGPAKVRATEPSTDRFRQIGLLSDPLRKTGVTAAETEQKKQTSLLEQIKAVLQQQQRKPASVPEGFWIA